MDDLVAFLRARLGEGEAALIRYRDGHDGPCLNYRGQEPEGYDEYDSCYLHIETADATPYRDVAFGLADIDAKRRIADLHQADDEKAEAPICTTCLYAPPCETLRALALPYADHPDYREEWRP
ncbi:DUF6221 family protein [Streptomyces aculeolatus]|nr:DUF6221 family protein [Streptomyces aculeolatus]